MLLNFIKYLAILGLFAKILPFKCQSIKRFASPQKLSDCSAKLDNGVVIDLKSLDNPSSPRKTSDGSYDYLFNPCSAFRCGASGTLATSATCQKAFDGKNQFNLGDQKSSSFDFIDGIFKINYVGAGGRKSILNCLCGKKEAFVFNGEGPTNTYTFSFTSPCCCQSGCNGSGNDGGGLSVGSVLLIIFFVVLVVYFIGGFVFMKFIRKTSGIEQIPNSSFWIAIPGNAKEGFKFVVSKVRPNRPNYTQI